MAALLAAATNDRRTMRMSPSGMTRLLRTPAPEKYPGQRTAYLQGAARTMTRAEMAENNRRVAEKRRERMERRVATRSVAAIRERERLMNRATSDKLTAV